MVGSPRRRVWTEIQGLVLVADLPRADGRRPARPPRAAGLRLRPRSRSGAGRRLRLGDHGQLRRALPDRQPPAVADRVRAVRRRAFAARPRMGGGRHHRRGSRALVRGRPVGRGSPVGSTEACRAAGARSRRSGRSRWSRRGAVREPSGARSTEGSRSSSTTTSPLASSPPTPRSARIGRSSGSSGHVADSLQGLEALAELGHGRDPRLTPALDMVVAKQDADGRWRNEHPYRGKPGWTWTRPGAQASG